MRVSDCMVFGAVTIEGGHPVSEAAQVMADEGVGMLVVGDERKAQGIITDRDIVVRCVSQGHGSDTCAVASHMTAPLTTISPDASPLDAAHLMRQKHIKRLPVEEAGVMTGVVSITDITQAMDQPLHDLLFGGGRTRKVPTSVFAGTLTHYFTKMGVAALDLEHPLHVGDRIHIVGHTTDLEQQVESLEIDHQQVDAAYSGDNVAVRVEARGRVGDAVYIVTN